MANTFQVDNSCSKKCLFGTYMSIWQLIAILCEIAVIFEKEHKKLLLHYLNVVIFVPNTFKKKMQKINSRRFIEPRIFKRNYKTTRL